LRSRRFFGRPSETRDRLERFRVERITGRNDFAGAGSCGTLAGSKFDADSNSDRRRRRYRNGPLRAGSR
jgi:hypothetical protein